MAAFGYFMCSAGGRKAWESLSRCDTIGNAVRRAESIFRQCRVPEPRASAEYLAVSAFGEQNRARLNLNKNEIVQRLRLTQYISLCQERQEQRTPIQYLVGDWDFHFITLRVRPPVLIPRPETEELVEYVLKESTSNEKGENVKFVDVGTGTGALTLALLKARPHWTAVALDCCSSAVDLCRENAKLLDLEDRCEVIHSSIEDWNGGKQGPFDFLVSNPPYIPEKDMPSLEPEVAWHEDRRALCGGKDGMDTVREILKKSPLLVRAGGVVWLEVDPSHPQKISNIVRTGRSVGALQYEKTLLDVRGKERFCKLNVS